MKFKLNMAKCFWNIEKDKEEIEKLKKLGFSFNETGYCSKCDCVDDRFLEISTLKELMEFVKEWKSVILDNESIMIYNNYIE